MIRLFVDGRPAGMLSGPGAVCRLTLEALAADGAAVPYRVTFEATEARLVASDGAAAFRRLLLLAPPVCPPEPSRADDEEALQAWVDWTPGDRLETVANLVNLDRPAEDLAVDVWAELNAGSDMAAALAKVCGARPATAAKS